MWTTLVTMLMALFVRRKATEGLPWAVFITLYLGRRAKKRGIPEMRAVAKEIRRLLGHEDDEKPRRQGRN